MHETELQGNIYITGRMADHYESAQPITKKNKEFEREIQSWITNVM